MNFNYKQIVTLNDLVDDTPGVLTKLEIEGKLLVLYKEKPSFVMSKLEETADNSESNVPMRSTHQIQSIKRIHTPIREFKLNGKPCSQEEMHNALVLAHEAIVTIYYEGDHSRQTIWQCSNYSQSSRLDSNLGSGYLRNWRELGIQKIRLEVYNE